MTLEIFAVFDVMFPRDWAICVKGKTKSAVEIWCKAIANFSPDEIKRGILSVEDLTVPPSLGKFKQLCRPPKPKQNGEAYRLRNDDLKTLDKLKANTITAKAEMRLINLILKKPIEDFDDETENKIESCYKNRRIVSDENKTVFKFLAAYR